MSETWCECVEGTSVRGPHHRAECPFSQAELPICPECGCSMWPQPESILSFACDEPTCANGQITHLILMFAGAVAIAAQPDESSATRRRRAGEVEVARKALAERIESLVEDAARYRWLRETFHAAKGGASLTVNDDLAVYQTPEPGKEVRVQWYPNTPVGFNLTEASTMDEAIDKAHAEQPMPTTARTTDQRESR
jgi:hypothetical protein